MEAMGTALRASNTGCIMASNNPEIRLLTFRGLKASGTVPLSGRFHASPIASKSLLTRAIATGDGKVFYGVHVDNGRIKGATKKALRELIEKFNLSVRLTPNQNIILCDVCRPWKRHIAASLSQAGLLIWLGGATNQTRLAKAFMNKVKVQELEKVLEPLFYSWKRKRQRGESFGDFTERMGFDTLLELVDKWKGLVKARPKYSLKVFAEKETYEAMARLARAQGLDAHELSMEIIRNYVREAESEAESEDNSVKQ